MANETSWGIWRTSLGVDGVSLGFMLRVAMRLTARDHICRLMLTQG